MEVQKAAAGPGSTSTGLVKGGTGARRGFSQMGSEGCHRVQTGPDGRQV